MAMIDIQHMISLTDAGKRGRLALIRDADQIVMRNNRAVAAVAPITTTIGTVSGSARYPRTIWRLLRQGGALIDRASGILHNFVNE